MHSSASASTQLVSAIHKGTVVTLTLPPADETIPRSPLRWGRAEEIGSPAYWASQAWMWELEAPDHYRLGMSLTEETLACMLGGYGIPAEVGLAAYARLRKQPANVLQDEERVLALLSEPLHVASRTVRYRFARQKAKRIAAAMRELPNIDEQLPDRALRDALTGLSGIGPKTASWIVRNWRGSDDVAILDIHILRLGRRLGIFDHSLRVERHYGSLEHQFLGFARALGARASMLDSVMWMTVRRMPARILANPTADRHPPRRASLKTGCSKGRQEALA